MYLQAQKRINIVRDHLSNLFGIDDFFGKLIFLDIQL
jgi:hypothetical protein